MAKVKKLPRRDQVKAQDCWNLAALYADDNAWEKDFLRLEKQIAKFAEFAGKLSDSAAVLAKCLTFDTEIDLLADRLGTFAFLKTAEDQANSVYQRMLGRYRNVASKAGQAASFIRPEIMAIPAEKMQKFLNSKELVPFRLVLERILRYQPHTLSQSEEKLLAMQSEMASTAGQVFRQLSDADLKFGFVKNEKGESVELNNATFSAFLHSPSRSVRKKAFHQYYHQFTAHENTFAATLAGSVQRDVYYAKARSYPSAREASLFHDNMPTSVYDNLIAAVRRHLPTVHQYYDIRRRKMRLSELHQYDTYVPILSDMESRHTWPQAVKVIIQSLAPLGTEYGRILEDGLLNGWCDRYPNVGKQSGAFSSGTYRGLPYILMNYQPEVLDHVFTLAHEAGHSMHSYYSAQNQPYQYYGYTIFVAEVASTFNEQLLSHHLLKKAKDKRSRAYLINREIDAIRSTIIRQTMFAEFEKVTHNLVEQGEPLTVEKVKSVYRELLQAYFGDKFALDPELDLECLRIPHFYNAFYVYKYATGLSAAIALSTRVLNGGTAELNAYLGFLKGGCSQDPLDLLRGAGVDMATPEPVDTALARFDALVQELDEIL